MQCKKTMILQKIKILERQIKEKFLKSPILIATIV